MQMEPKYVVENISNPSKQAPTCTEDESSGKKSQCEKNKLSTGTDRCSKHQWKCHLCPKQFKRRGDYNRHILIHTGEKPFVCQINDCFKRFNTSFSLKRHSLTHTGESPFECDRCGHKFRGRGDLKRHFRIHSREYPYICDLCSRRFVQRAHLNRHMKTQHENLEENGGDEFRLIEVKNRKKFICPEMKCGKHFLRTKSLKKHIHQIHHNAIIMISQNVMQKLGKDHAIEKKTRNNLSKENRLGRVIMYSSKCKKKKKELIGDETFFKNDSKSVENSRELKVNDEITHESNCLHHHNTEHQLMHPLPHDEIHEQADQVRFQYNQDILHDSHSSLPLSHSDNLEHPHSSNHAHNHHHGTQCTSHLLHSSLHHPISHSDYSNNIIHSHLLLPDHIRNSYDHSRLPNVITNSNEFSLDSDPKSDAYECNAKIEKKIGKKRN